MKRKGIMKETGRGSGTNVLHVLTADLFFEDVETSQSIVGEEIGRASCRERV